MRLLAPLLLWLVLSGGAFAQSLEALIAALPEGSYADRAGVVAEIAATGDARAPAVLQALAAGELAARKADGAVIRVTGKGAKAQGFELLTGAELAFWLDWLEEAAESGLPSRFRIHASEPNGVPNMNPATRFARAASHSL